MKFEVKDRGDAKIITVLEDHVTVGNVREFRSMVQELIDQGHTRVVLNLRDVKRIDSMGLGAIVGMSEALKYAKGQLVLLNLQYPVKELLRLTDLDRVLAIVDATGDEESS